MQVSVEVNDFILIGLFEVSIQLQRFYASDEMTFSKASRPADGQERHNDELKSLDSCIPCTLKYTNSTVYTKRCAVSPCM
jgi:hypothetical protein